MKRLLNVVLCIGCFQCVQFKNGVNKLLKPIKLFEDIKKYDKVLKEEDRDLVAYLDLVPKMITMKKIKLPVDHFDPNNRAKWEMRYLRNPMFFKPNSPIFIIVGGDEGFSENLLTEGYIFELAKEMNGDFYTTEHRYYGKSHTHKEIKYLHSTQAIQDLHELIKHIKNGYDSQYHKSKVVLIGGGYAGSLAVWTKQKYPNQIDVVIASGAPLLAVSEFEQYAVQAVNTYMKKAHNSCLKRIKEVFLYYFSCLEDNNFKQLATYANICPNVDMRRLLNQQTFFLNDLALLMAGVEDSVLALRTSCMFFETQHRPIPKTLGAIEIESLHKIKEAAALVPQGECLNFDFNDLVTAFHQEEFKENKYRLYQTCNEFGSFPTTSFLEQPFNNAVPVEYYYHLCSSVFGTKYDEKEIEQKVNETNFRYGGLRPNVTGVVFVAGEIDPFKSLGVSDRLNANNAFIEIKGESHTSDLKPSFYFDKKPLTRAREEIKQIVKRWLRNTTMAKLM